MNTISDNSDPFMLDAEYQEDPSQQGLVLGGQDAQWPGSTYLCIYIIHIYIYREGGREGGRERERERERESETSIHPSIHPCIHPSMHACMHAYIHACIQFCICSVCMQTYILCTKKYDACVHMYMYVV